VLGAVGRAVEEQELTALERAVDDRLREVRIVQHLAPLGEG